MKRSRNILVVVTLAVLLTVALVAADVSQQLPEEIQHRLDHVRADLDGVKTDLPLYNCCIDPACNFCALAVGLCVCGNNVETDAGVCGECLLGWQAGKGHASGVQADQVRSMHGEMLQAMYDELAEHFSPHEHHH